MLAVWRRWPKVDTILAVWESCCQRFEVIFRGRKDAVKNGVPVAR